MDPSKDSRVKAIRSDPLIGKFTLSDIDETWTDKEIVYYLDEINIKNPGIMKKTVNTYINA